MMNIDTYDNELFHFKDHESHKYCHVWVATAIVGTAVLGAVVNAYTTSKAVDAQKSSIASANAIQKEQYNTTRSDLSPYREMGVNASQQLQDQLPFLTSPIVMDQEALEKTPGYQFTKTQGLKAVQNSAAARGLGVSGAALKGAASFATGLADQTYQTQFNLENTNRTNAYNRLKGLIDTGGNAAAMTGNFGQQTANAVSGNTVAAGATEAAGWNRFGNSVQSGANNIAGYAMYKGLYGSPSGDPSAGKGVSGVDATV